MERACSGCAWISAEIDRRQGLLAKFEQTGDHRFVQIAEEGIASLVCDWRAHIERDHSTEMTVTVRALPAQPNSFLVFNVYACAVPRQVNPIKTKKSAPFSGTLSSLSRLFSAWAIRK